MTRLIAGVLAAAVALALPLAADAATTKKKKKRYVRSESQGEMYGSATARQRANTRAFENGGYYEQIPDAHVFGSRGWWYLKEREMNNNRN